MPRLDHMSFAVKDWQRSRDFYRDVLGFAVEFEIPERKTVAMRDDAGLTIFMGEADEVIVPAGLSFTVQVADVEATHRDLAARGIAFVHPPQKVFWGYGAELLDPDGYRVMLWDEKTMKQKGGG